MMPKIVPRSFIAIIAEVKFGESGFSSSSCVNISLRKSPSLNSLQFGIFLAYSSASSRVSKRVVSTGPLNPPSISSKRALPSSSMTMSCSS